MCTSHETKWGALESTASIAIKITVAIAFAMAVAAFPTSAEDKHRHVSIEVIEQSAAHVHRGIPEFAPGNVRNRKSY